MASKYGDRKVHKTKTCADCPATIPAIGGKDRCAACSDKHADARARAYAAKRWQKRKAAAQQETHG